MVQDRGAGCMKEVTSSFELVTQGQKVYLLVRAKNQIESLLLVVTSPFETNGIKTKRPL